MKVAIIAIAKNENLYINEWLEYHFNLGFDNIIICENDDELILKDIIHDDRVIIEDFTKIYGVQQMAYQETFRKYKDKFDWFLFIDIDEFLVLENHDNVKDFIKSYGEEPNCIKLTWRHFNDNGELDVIDGNYNVFNRFKTVVDTKMDRMTKQFIKGNISEDDIKFLHQHEILGKDIRAIDVLGNKVYYGRELRNGPINKVAWLNHYRTKTIGEYVRQKYFRGGPNRNNVRYHRLSYFFETNEKTPEKVEYAEKLINEIEDNMKQ